MIWRFHKEARKEFLESVAWYNSRKPGLGRQFFTEVQTCIDRICAKPDSFRKISPGVRVCRTARFPYLLIYRIAHEIEIIAVMHGRRRPGYWTERL